MPTTTLRLELFTSSLSSALHFYVSTLNFQILVRKNNDNYIFLRRDDIYLALLPSPDPITFPAVPWPAAADTQTDHPPTPLPTNTNTNAAGEAPARRREVLARTAFRRPPYGPEIVIEVDDLAAERDRIVGAGYELAADIEKQEWGLWDFRVVDGDGYYLRFTTRSPGRNGLGQERQGEVLA